MMQRKLLFIWLVVVLVVAGIIQVDGDNIKSAAQVQSQPTSQNYEVHTMSAYSAGDGHTPSRTMASGRKVFVGACACSSRYPFGTVFYWVEGNMTFVCWDRGGKRIEKWNWLDIYVATPKSAKIFGVKRKQHFVVTRPKGNVK